MIGTLMLIRVQEIQGAKALHPRLNKKVDFRLLLHLPLLHQRSLMRKKIREEAQQKPLAEPEALPVEPGPSKS